MDPSSESKVEDIVTSLNWSNWKLCGRERESQLLEECYLTRKDRDLVLVTGELGIGKTVLTSILQSRVGEDLGILIRGTFSVSPEPYEAFIEAFADLVTQLKQKPDYKIIQSDLNQAIRRSGAENFLIPDSLAMFETFMNGEEDQRGGPGVSDEFRSEEKMTATMDDAHPEMTTATDRQHRFVNAVTKIVEAVGSVFPLVIVLDNLMWADPNSLLLLESLCVGGKLSNVLMVATCRGDEVAFDDLLSVKLRSMEGRGLRLTDISLHPLSFEDTYNLIRNLQNQMDDDACTQFAEIIHRCTGGNPLLICELLKILEKKGIDSEILQKHLDYSDLVNAKLSQMAPMGRQILELIACLGGKTVHESVLTELLPGKDEQEMRCALLEAQEKGFLAVDTQIGECSFLHGSIQVAAYRLIPEKQRIAIHYDIAQRLCSWLHEEQLEENIFLVVHQYLRGHDCIPSNDKAMVAGLCLRASRKAAFSAAFSSAGDFIRFGISLLNSRSKWRDEYDLTLALMNVAIELEFCNGNHDAVDELHKEILDHSRTVMETMTSYTTHLTSLGSRGNTEEAILEGLDILALLGESFPRRMIFPRTVAGLIKTRNMLKRTSDEQILTLPRLTDAKIQVISNILHLFFVYVFLHRSELVPLVSIRVIELTLRYGLSPMSGTSFGVFGMVLMAACDDYEEAYRCGQLALKLMDVVKCKELTSRMYTAVYGFLTPYKEPLRDTIKPLEDAYRLNIVTGDVEMAITSASICYGNCLQAGTPLFQVIPRFQALDDVCNLHNQHWNQRIMNMSTQFAMNLSGRNSLDRPFELTGEAMTEKYVMTEILKDKNDVQLAWLYFLKFMMAVYLCDLPISLEAEPLAIPLKKYTKYTGIFTRQQQVFHEGILCCFLGKATSKRKKRRRHRFLARANNCLRVLQHFATVCPSNFKNKAVLLEAEIETLRERKHSSEIIPLYEESALLAKKEGFLHEEALALEKAGYHVLYLQESALTASLARPFFDQAIKVYEHHGAMLKVQQVKKVTSRLNEIVQLKAYRNPIPSK